MKKISIIFFLFSAISWAQTLDSVQTLDEIIITGTKYPIAQKNSGKIVAKITRKVIELNPHKSVAQLLDEIAGIEINGNLSVPGKNLGVYAQGGKNSQVLVIIDGIPVIDPSGIDMSYDLTLLTAEQIESIEVMRGAAGTLYGSGAATAVINVKTLEQVEKAFSLQVGSTLGSSRTQNDKEWFGKKWNQYLNINGKKKDFTYHFSFANFNSDNQTEAISEENNFLANPYDKRNVLAKIGLQIAPEWNIRLGGIFANQFHVFDAAAFEDSEVNENYNAEYKLDLMSLWQHEKGKLHWTTEFKNYDRTYHQFNTWAQNMEDYFYKTQSFQSDVFHVLNVSNQLDFLAGINFQKHQTDNKTPYGNIEKKIGKFHTIDPYLHLTLKDWHGFNFSVGSRMNIHSNYGKHSTFSLNPSYVLNFDKNRYAKILGSWSSAYIVPGIYQLFSAYGNENLTPEVTETIEIGTELNLNSTMNFSILYFERVEDHSIIFVTDTTTWQSQYQNDHQNSLFVSGLEASWTVKPIKNTQFRTNYTYTKVSKTRPYSVPKHKWNSKFLYEISKNSNMQFSYQYVSDRKQAFFNSATYASEIRDLNNYHLLGISWNKAFYKDKFHINVAVDNLFNSDYVETIGYTTMGRNYALSLNYKM